jgi:hypothetical protein
MARLRSRSGGVATTEERAAWVEQANERLGQPGSVFSFSFDADTTALVPWRGRLLPAVFSAVVDDPESPWLVRLDISTGPDGETRCTSFAVDARHGGEPVTPRSLRAVPIGRYLEEVPALASYRAERSPEGDVRFVRASSAGDTLHIPREPTKRTWTRLSDEHLQEVADVYRAAMQEEGRKAPRQAIRADPRWAGTVSATTVARWVEEARTRGFLPPTTQRQPKA